MQITSLQSTTTRNGDFVTVSYVNEDGDTITVMKSASDEVMHAVTDFINGGIDADHLVAMFNVTEDVKKVCANDVNARLSKVSDRITTDGNHVFFDGASFSTLQIDQALENHLVRLIKSGDESLANWARFTERLYDNVDIRIREQLVRWLAAQEWLTIDSKGRLVGYRGCEYDTQDDTNTPYAKHHGEAIVDGTYVNGRIPNRIGSVIELRRADVTADPTVGCASGLHVGTYDYAYSWAGNGGWVLRVAVAPEDIVSVPYECESQKIRCCKFEVLDATRKEFVDEDSYRDCLNYDADDDLCDEYGDDCDSCPGRFDCDEYDEDFDDEDDFDYSKPFHDACSKSIHVKIDL